MVFNFLSVMVLPLSVFSYSINQNSSFFRTFAEKYSTAKSVLFITLELIKKICFLSFYLVNRKLLIDFLLIYCNSYAAFLTCYMLYLQWTIYKHVLLSVDIEKNPGPDRETLKFCSWNLNSISAHEYIRVSLLEAYNSLYKYDLIGIVETHLDNTVDEGNLSLRGYNLTKSNHPGNLKKGGVGLYVKESFPAKNRADLVTLPECIVSEIQLDGKKYFFAVLYKSPSQTAAEFEIFITNFDVMLFRMSAENPYAVIITGDFNCRSPQWWENDNENEEGKIFEPHTSELGLHQLISEATHIMGDSKSCIDLIFTDQPNLFLESGVCNKVIV